MHVDTLKQISHEHDFGGNAQDNEKRTLKVILLTGITMCVEIIAGILTGSMALLADGWHMGTHAFALGIAYFAYVMARRFSGSPKFGFGTGKFGILAGYTSALFLGGTAIYMIV
jgi:cation diffusion facilitator family transporter